MRNNSAHGQGTSTNIRTVCEEEREGNCLTIMVVPCSLISYCYRQRPPRTLSLLIYFKGTMHRRPLYTPSRSKSRTENSNKKGPSNVGSTLQTRCNQAYFCSSARNRLSFIYLTNWECFSHWPQAENIFTLKSLILHLYFQLCTYRCDKQLLGVCDQGI